MPDPNEGTIVKSARITGYWTEGIVKGLLIAGPPVLILIGSLGFLLKYTRFALTWGGKGGIS
jgi:hypothetical protein